MSHSELTTILEAETLAQDPAEERVTRRLRDYWNTLRGGQQFPSRANFRIEAVTGLGPNAFALDLAQDADDPVFRFVGKALTEDCGKDFTLKPLSAVPTHTLLAEVARRYTDVIDKKTPVEFAEEHVGADGSTALFRGAMLPFSEDGQTVDFIVGAITYKKKPSETTLAPVHAESPVADTAKADEVAAVMASPVGPVGGLTRLSQSLQECQALACEVVQADLKSRETLYRALESAYAFYFECEADPEAYAEILDMVSLCNSENLEASFMPRIQETKLNKGHLRKLKALRKSLGKKIADEVFSKWLKEMASGKKKWRLQPYPTRLGSLSRASANAAA